MRTRADLDRAELAVLGREWLLHGHLQDRVGMALVLEVADREVMQGIAIEEWMAASPVYSRRMQRALGFGGGDVGTILKNLQLDVGAPHQFLDFRFRLDDAEHGAFWLDRCGALLDVEPMGEAFVHGMCHTIEDPTFDATAGATNPRAQVRPVHRPPRVPADRAPHCSWRVEVTPDAAAVAPTALELAVRETPLAQLPAPRHPADDDGGWRDYGGAFDPDFALEDLSRGALLTALDEFALQSHLLLLAFLRAVGQALGPDAAAGMLPRLVRGWCGLTSERLRDAFALDESPDGVATLLALHPMLHPVSWTGASYDGKRFHLSSRDESWLGIPLRTSVLESALQGAFPHVRLDESLTLSFASASAPSAPELALARISTGARFRFTARRPVRVS